MFYGNLFVAVLLCMSQVFGQKEEVGATPDVVALMNHMNRCRFQTVMCCYTRRRAQNGGGSPGDNTDVCRAQGVLTDGDREGRTHCHGFTWAGRDAAMTDANKRRLLDFINTQDHFGRRGYFGAIGEYNKCDCIENMPIVSRSDCSELNGAANPRSCDPRGFYGERVGNGNNLADKYRSLGGNPALFSLNLVGNCTRSPLYAPPLPNRGRPSPTPIRTSTAAAKSSTKAPTSTAVRTSTVSPKSSTRLPTSTPVRSSIVSPKSSTRIATPTRLPDAGYPFPTSTRSSTRIATPTRLPDAGYPLPTSTRVPPKTSTRAPASTPVRSCTAAKSTTRAPPPTPVRTSTVSPKSSTRVPAPTPARSSTRAPTPTRLPDTAPPKKDCDSNVRKL
ncbi:hypothetical protein MP638_006609 [Amoeboaphelidium occidentale]|nr:hypothetical protein MP638_006609 [Amoeboaphelidium occidentale]